MYSADFTGSPGLSGGVGCPYGPECEPHYATMCKAWSRDMDADALASCSKLGYYFVDGKVPGVRIIVPTPAIMCYIIYYYYKSSIHPCFWVFA